MTYYQQTYNPWPVYQQLELQRCIYYSYPTPPHSAPNENLQSQGEMFQFLQSGDTKVEDKYRVKSEKEHEEACGKFLKKIELPPFDEKNRDHRRKSANVSPSTRWRRDKTYEKGYREYRKPYNRSTTPTGSPKRDRADNDESSKKRRHESKEVYDPLTKKPANMNSYTIPKKGAKTGKQDPETRNLYKEKRKVLKKIEALDFEESEKVLAEDEEVVKIVIQEEETKDPSSENKNEGSSFKEKFNNTFIVLEPKNPPSYRNPLLSERSISVESVASNSSRSQNISTENIKVNSTEQQAPIPNTTEDPSKPNTPTPGESTAPVATDSITTKADLKLLCNKLLKTIKKNKINPVSPSMIQPKINPISPLTPPIPLLNLNLNNTTENIDTISSTSTNSSKTNPFQLLFAQKKIPGILEDLPNNPSTSQTDHKRPLAPKKIETNLNNSSVPNTKTVIPTKLPESQPNDKPKTNLPEPPKEGDLTLKQQQLFQLMNELYGKEIVGKFQNVLRECEAETQKGKSPRKIERLNSEGEKKSENNLAQNPIDLGREIKDYCAKKSKDIAASSSRKPEYENQRKKEYRQSDSNKSSKGTVSILEKYNYLKNVKPKESPERNSKEQPKENAQKPSDLVKQIPEKRKLSHSSDSKDDQNEGNVKKPHKDNLKPKLAANVTSHKRSISESSKDFHPKQNAQNSPKVSANVSCIKRSSFDVSKEYRKECVVKKQLKDNQKTNVPVNVTISKRSSTEDTDSKNAQEKRKSKDDKKLQAHRKSSTRDSVCDNNKTLDESQKSKDIVPSKVLSVKETVKNLEKTIHSVSEKCRVADKRKKIILLGNKIDRSDSFDNEVANKKIKLLVPEKRNSIDNLKQNVRNEMVQKVGSSSALKNPSSNREIVKTKENAILKLKDQKSDLENIELKSTIRKESDAICNGKSKNNPSTGEIIKPKAHKIVSPKDNGNKNDKKKTEVSKTQEKEQIKEYQQHAMVSIPSKQIELHKHSKTQKERIDQPNKSTEKDKICSTIPDRNRDRINEDINCIFGTEFAPIKVKEPKSAETNRNIGKENIPAEVRNPNSFKVVNNEQSPSKIQEKHRSRRKSISVVSDGITELQDGNSDANIDNLYKVKIKTPIVSIPKLCISKTNSEFGQSWQVKDSNDKTKSTPVLILKRCDYMNSSKPKKCRQRRKSELDILHTGINSMFVEDQPFRNISRRRSTSVVINYNENDTEDFEVFKTTSKQDISALPPIDKATELNDLIVEQGELDKFASDLMCLMKNSPPCALSTTNQNRSSIRIESISFDLVDKVYVYESDVEKYVHKDMTKFTTFLDKLDLRKIQWSGFCQQCDDRNIYFDPQPISMEFQHLKYAHGYKFHENSITGSLNPSNSQILNPWATQSFNYNKDPSLSLIISTFKCTRSPCCFYTNDKSKMMDHMRVHQTNSNKAIKCSYCSHTSSSPEDLVDHILTGHDHSNAYCRYCFYRSNLGNVQEHLKIYHPDKPQIILDGNNAGIYKHQDLDGKKLFGLLEENIKILECQECDDKFYPMDAFLKHMQEDHEQQYYKCDVCEKVVPVSNYFPHMESHNLGPFDCVYCDFGAINGKNIKKHVLDEHPNELPYICVRYFRDTTVKHGNIESMSVFPIVQDESVKEDVKKTIPKEVFAELLSDTSRSDLVISHVEGGVSVDGNEDNNQEIDEIIAGLPKQTKFDKEIECNYCAYKSKSKVHLARHLQFHKTESSEPEVFEPVRRKSFSEDRNIKKMPIPICKTVEDAPQFVPLNSRFVCNSRFCIFVSITEKDFRQHLILEHRGEKEYECPHCPQIIKYNSEAIISHYRLHDENLFQCGLCQYFARTRKEVVCHQEYVHDFQDDLKVIRVRSLDLRTQLKEHPDLHFECQYCDEIADSYGKMEEHIKNVHQLNAQFECNWCRKQTTSITGLKVHNKWKHPKEKPSYIYHFKSVIMDVSSLKNKPSYKRNKKMRRLTIGW